MLVALRYSSGAACSRTWRPTASSSMRPSSRTRRTSTSAGARLLGRDIRYVPETVAWHVRGWAGGRLPPPRTLPLEARLHSFKNRYLLLLKNDDLSNLLRSLPAAFGWELLRHGHALLRDRSLYRVHPMIMGLLRRELRHRQDITARRRVSAAEMRHWFRDSTAQHPID